MNGPESATRSYRAEIALLLALGAFPILVAANALRGAYPGWWPWWILIQIAGYALTLSIGRERSHVRAVAAQVTFHWTILAAVFFRTASIS